MEKLTPSAQAYWQSYLKTLSPSEQHELAQAFVESSVAGNVEIADRLLALYLNGKKTAGSSLVQDFVVSGDPLPKVGDFWIILDSKSNPRCIVKTVRLEINLFKDVGEKIAKAEGEGDLSLWQWRVGHRKFFTPSLERFGISDLDQAEVITHFFEVVYR